MRRRSRSDNTVSVSLSFEGQTHMPILSLLSVGATSSGVSELLTPISPVKRHTKSSSLKCLEQTSEDAEGTQFFRFLLTKSTQAFLRFLASGLVSFTNGILWRAIPFFEFDVFEHPNTTHLCGILPENFFSKLLKKYIF